jgi:ribosomal subunit interface protein
VTDGEQEDPMNVIVKGHHFHVSDHLRDVVARKLDRCTRFFDRITKMEVVFSKEKVPAPVRYNVEVFGTTSIGTLHAHASASEPEAAVDAVIHKLETQIKRQKDKVVRKPKGGIRAAAVSPRAASARAAALRG